MRLDLQPGLALQVGESELRLRIDRVYLAATDRLDLGVRVRDEAEHDRAQFRRLAVPTTRVLLERDAGAAIELRQQERPVRDGSVPLLRVTDAVVPDRQHVGARQRVLGKHIAEQLLPRGEVPLERDRDDLAVPLHAGDVLPAEWVDVVLVLRVHGGLPRETPVLGRDLHAVAPLRVLADVVRHALWAVLQRVPADQVGLVLEAGREQERAADHRRLEHDVPERVAIDVQDQVETPIRTAALLGSEDERPCLGGRDAASSIHPRRAGGRERKRCEHHPGTEPELPSMHRSLLLRLRSASPNDVAPCEHQNSQLSALHQPRLENRTRVSGDFENESRDQKTHSTS